MWIKLELAHMALRLKCHRIAHQLLRDALGVANVECLAAKPAIMRAMNHARAIKTTAIAVKVVS